MVLRRVRPGLPDVGDGAVPVVPIMLPDVGPTRPHPDRDTTEGDRMNGTDRDDYGGRTVAENAERTARRIIEDTVRHNGERAANPEFDLRAYVLGKRVCRTEMFMTDMNGPTAYACFVLDDDNDIRHAYVYYASSGDESLVALGQFDAEDLYALMKDYR